MSELMKYTLLGQFVINPVILWGCLHFCARDEHQIRFRDVFLGSAVALATGVLVWLGLEAKLGPANAILMADGVFFSVVFAWMIVLAKASFLRTLSAVFLFFCWRVAIDAMTYHFFLEPIAEVAY